MPQGDISLEQMPVISYGVTGIAVIPCRAEPSHRSEMTTQLLFGELYSVIQTKDDWYEIITEFDQYRCWIPKNQHQHLLKDDFEFLKSSSIFCTSEMFSFVQDQNNNLSVIFPGSTIAFKSDNLIQFGSKEFLFDGDCIARQEDPRNFLVSIAPSFINSPYLWGGRTPAGIDCSGYTQVLYKMAGIRIKRDASQQALMGTPLSFVEEAAPGDLAFFDNPEGKITHVGMILGENKIIHAAGKVRIDQLDHQGIYNAELNKYTHSLRVIKSFL